VWTTGKLSGLSHGQRSKKKCTNVKHNAIKFQVLQFIIPYVHFARDLAALSTFCPVGRGYAQSSAMNNEASKIHERQTQRNDVSSFTIYPTLSYFARDLAAFSTFCLDGRGHAPSSAMNNKASKTHERQTQRNEFSSFTSYPTSSLSQGRPN
jgi:hypothetical protein